MASLNTDLCIARQREAVNLLVRMNNKMPVPLVSFTGNELIAFSYATI